MTGGGTVLHNGVLANYGVSVKFLKNGQIQGNLRFIDHRPTGNVMLKSNALTSLAIVGDTAVLLSKATLDGQGNYTFEAIVTDKGEPGIDDQFWLRVTGPNGALVPDMSFAPLTLTGGNNQVPQGVQ